MNRRDLLKSASLLPLATVPVPDKPADRRRALRVAYIGDTHMTADKKPMESVAKALRHLQNQSDKPAFILHGGDVIMDALAQDKAAVQKQWEAWKTVVKAECSLPIEYCIGNHDVWGQSEAKADDRYGKAWAVEQLNLGNRFRAFTRSGWHFLVLDGVQTTPDGRWYTAHLDPEQLNWLNTELAGIDPKMPVLILSHIPIVTASVYYDRSIVKDGNIVVPGGWNHTDAADLIKLFHQYPNVRAALSGHMHLLDRVDYNRVSYFCNGAISGNWWNSNTYHETKAGYALFDLYDDGTVERTFYHYDA